MSLYEQLSAQSEFSFWQQVFGTTNELRNYGFLSSLLGIGTQGISIPDEDGWYSWELKPPDPNKLIQYLYKDSDTPLIGYAKDIDYLTNVRGMKWRLTGIAKESD